MSPLVGQFGEGTGRPFIEGRLILPRMNLSFDVSFLVDTGADSTVLMPDDGIRVGLDYSRLRDGRRVGSRAGPVEAFPEQAVILFSIPGERLYLHRVDIFVFPLAPDLLGTPSLLGRDVLDCWRMTYSPVEGTIEFEVLAADHEVERRRSRTASGTLQAR